MEYFGVTNFPIFFLRLNICLIFSFIVFRMLYFVALNFYTRLLFAILVAFIALNSKGRLITIFLNIKIFQLLFYYSLCIDEQFKSIDPVSRISIFLCVLSTYLYTLFFVNGARFVCLGCFFYWAFYRNLKSNFVNFSSPYSFVSVKLDPNVRPFTWLDVIENMYVACHILFKTTVVNKLSKTANETPFKYVIRKVFPKYVVVKNKIGS